MVQQGERHRYTGHGHEPHPPLTVVDQEEQLRTRTQSRGEVAREAGKKGQGWPWGWVRGGNPRGPGPREGGAGRILWGLKALDEGRHPVS